MLPVVSVIGLSGSGKTTLIEYLISNLAKEGLKIGAVKHIHRHSFSIDTKGKDTWKYSRAGARVVACATPEEVAVIRKMEVTHENFDEIVNLVATEGLDLLILEGFHSFVAKRRDIFKIITAKNRADLERTIDGTLGPILAITGLFAGKKVALPGLTIPILDLGSEGEKILKLVKHAILKV